MTQPEERTYWIFTFGCGMAHGGQYVRIKGTYGEARKKMFEKYGRQWAFQYSEEEWQRFFDDPNRDWPMETELETIE